MKELDRCALSRKGEPMTPTGLLSARTSFVRQFVVGVTTAIVSIASCNAASIEFIGSVLATDISADGSVVVGNTEGDFETFRWTSATGVVPLGRATVPVLGVGAGTPDVSDDGTKVSATILDDTGTLATQGLWTLGSGWQQLQPYPPDGGVLDQSLGSAFGLSGDGTTVTGLYWRPGQPGGLAHATSGTLASGVMDLGSDGASSRASGANYDGSVLVGFDESPTFGVRRPAVWVNGVVTNLAALDNGEPGEVNATNGAGTIIVGENWDPVNFLTGAAIWRFNGATWDEQQIGVLPGTDPIFGGLASCTDTNSDGSLVIGFNRFSFFGGATGFVWTPAGGMVSAAEWLTSLGITLVPELFVTDLSAISADGLHVVGTAVDINTFQSNSFIVTIPEPTSLGAIGLLGLLAATRLRRRSRRRR
jgi:uncharacterized membrane protein